MVFVVYIGVFLLSFFAESFVVSRYTCEDPTSPDTFFPLVGLALAWPITIPFAAIIFLLIGIAKLAIELSRYMK